MIERYTRSQIDDFLRHHDDAFVFAALPTGEWGVGKATGSLTRSGQVSFMLLRLEHAWDIDPPGDLLSAFGNGDRGYYVYHRQVIAMFVESDIEKAREFLDEMKRIDETYKQECKGPLLKMKTSIAVLQARMNP